MYKVIKTIIKNLKLFILYWTRIVFVKSNFKISFIKKIKANLNRGFLADQWILYDFDNNNKNEYLSEFDWYKSRYINEPFNFMLNNKIVLSEILKQYIRVPENYLIKNNGRITTFKSEEVTEQYVIELLREKKSVFVKPYGKGKGNGINRLKFLNGNFYIDDVKCSEFKIIELLKSRDNWFICEEIKQSGYASEIYDRTVNTIRLITFKDIATHHFKIFFAVQRIGTEKTIPVDNGSKGGLIAKIDLNTGELSTAKSLYSLDTFDIHPDSGKKIKGITIPEWNKIKETILKLAENFPYLQFIAWDIVLTEDGLCVIEANTSSGVNIIQIWGGQRLGELGEFYRYHNIIK